MVPMPDGEFLLPIFPLPNVVLFPQTHLPLHIFEPRYRQMVKDALAGEERIGIVLLRPGWENAYFGAPPVYAYGTLGTIEHAVPLEDGRFNILLRGDARFEILEEVATTPYRTARVVARREDTGDPQQALAQREWLADLARTYIEVLPNQVEVPELGTAGLEALTNALIMALNVEPEMKQQLLESRTVLQRAEMVGAELETRIASLAFLKPYRRDGDPSLN